MEIKAIRPANDGKSGREIPGSDGRLGTFGIGIDGLGTPNEGVGTFIPGIERSGDGRLGKLGTLGSAKLGTTTGSDGTGTENEGEDDSLPGGRLGNSTDGGLGSSGRLGSFGSAKDGIGIGKDGIGIEMTVLNNVRSPRVTDIVVSNTDIHHPIFFSGRIFAYRAANWDAVVSGPLYPGVSEILSA